MRKRLGRGARASREPHDRLSTQLALFGEVAGKSGEQLSAGEPFNEGDDFRLVRLNDEARELFSTLTTALALLNQALLPDSESFPADLIALLLRPTTPLARACRTAASALTRYAAEDGGSGAVRNSASSIESARAALSRATTEFAVDSGLQPAEIERRGIGDSAYGDAIELLREFGIEEHGRFLTPLFDRESGAPLLGVTDMTRAALDVYLFSRVFDRLEVSVLVAPFLRMEREASAWQFDRWSARAKGAPDMNFTRRVREQEWSLAGREMMYMGRSVAAAYIEQKIGRQAPERQKRLARGLAESRTSAFSVIEKDGDHAVFEDLVTGRRYTVHEHNLETDYRPGMLGLGRVIPVDDYHLRSPGMALLSSEDSAADEPLGQMLSEGMRQGDPMTRMVLTEGLMSNMILRVDVPRRVLPAPSVAAARERVSEVTDMLESEGFANTVAPDDVPPEIAQRSSEFDEIRTMQYEVDETLADWLRPLMEQAKRGQPRHHGARPRRARARKAKKRHR